MGKNSGAQKNDSNRRIYKMKKIILATSNSGKVNEFRSLLNNASIEIIPQTEINIVDVEETGCTFVENAILKARHAANQSGLPAIADDSGLVVPALNGAPGIRSARFAGEASTSTDNIKKLLQQLTYKNNVERNAYFYCVLVFMKTADDPVPLICEGKWHGLITLEPKGTHGFGYDPVFYIPALQKTAAEISADIKNKISHRGQAMQLMKQKLAENL